MNEGVEIANGEGGGRIVTDGLLNLVSVRFRQLARRDPNQGWYHLLHCRRAERQFPFSTELRNQRGQFASSLQITHHCQLKENTQQDGACIGKLLALQF